MKHMTLEQIIESEKAKRTEGGMFGIIECKKSIKFSTDVLGHNIYELLGEFVERANEDVFFNKAMVLACWEMINER